MTAIHLEGRNMEELCLHDLFLEQAQKTPNGIAVVDGDSSMTYEELNEVTDRLAIQLIEDFGVGPDSVVAILLPRSLQYVISYVSILKAGGTYMPLELVYPKALLERAVTETETKVVLTTAQYTNRIAGSSCPCIVLGDVKNATTPSLQSLVPYETTLTYPPPSYVHPNADHLAFCVMSSGTTGTPKGICQTHRAAVHSYMDRWTRFPYHPEGDRVAAGVFFVWEMFRPLCQGSTVVVIPDHVLFDPPAVTKFVQDKEITRMLFTPSLLQLLLDTLSKQTLQDQLAGLRYLWLCGEVVSRDLAVTFSDYLPNVELMNLYSISECHDVSIGDLKRELDAERKYATCGTAIPGVQFYIVDLEEEADTTETSTSGDGKLSLVAEGETGEVYVGGPVVGRGYLHMPEKTADRFVTNPFPTELPNCNRLYRTGDLGRLLPNGQLEILGRCDFMVKIRGYSVVLGAIETALAKHPKLSSSVVLAVGQEGSRDKKLVAYVVPTNWHDAPSASSVRSFLKDHVPPYAIPTTFCVIDALPVAATAAGKLDRKKLPALESATRLRAFSEDIDSILQENDVPNGQVVQQLTPQNDTETTILEIWSKLLNLQPNELSAMDNFFEVGGHSLLATQLVAAVNKAFDKTTDTGLSILNMVDAPTIRDMSNIILQKDGAVKNTSIDLSAEADALDPSIFPFATRKGNGISRFRAEASTWMHPRVVFLTGATGYLGSHILAELLATDVTVIALARAKTDADAKDRLMSTLAKHKLTSKKVSQQMIEERLVGIAGDLSKPLLGVDGAKFKSLALEIDSIIHCGAEVNLIKPYESLKESNVLGTQEILRLATTNGLVKTKVKPVHYISTNGIFPVDKSAYDSSDFVDDGNNNMLCADEDIDLNKVAPHLLEGYARSKWVAEQMCTIVESRGLPVSIFRPGNMAGSSLTGVQNPDDLNYLLLRGMIDSGCAPIVDTDFALDMTPVDFAAEALVELVVHAPHTAIGQRMHLQAPQKAVPLTQVVQWMEESLGLTLEKVTREAWVQRIAKVDPKLASGWDSFEKYFEASTWMSFSAANLQQALKQHDSGRAPVQCPKVDGSLLANWFG